MFESRHVADLMNKSLRALIKTRRNLKPDTDVFRRFSQIHVLEERQSCTQPLGASSVKSAVSVGVKCFDQYTGTMTNQRIKT